MKFGTILALSTRSIAICLHPPKRSIEAKLQEFVLKGVQQMGAA
jgi:hypothetical protein